MARAQTVRKQSPTGPAAEADGADGRFEWMTALASLAAVALVLARGMMLETLRDPFQVELGAQPVPRGPGAATGLILDLLCCLPALLVLLRSTLDRTFILRRSPANLLMLILGAWAMLSGLWASDRFAAVISAAHWLSALVLLWSLAQLVRSWAHLRLVAAAAFGLLLVLTAHGIIYRVIELPELKEQVEQDWPRILQERGWEPDSYIATRFKMRVMAGEMIGFSASPNTFGAMLVMLGIVTAGLALQRIVLRDEFGWPLLLGLALVPAAWVLLFTNSRTALVTPVLAAALLAMAWFAREPILRHRKRLFIGAILLFAALAVAVVGHGLRHGTLFHESLTFRWKYWVGAWRIFVQHTLSGVGFANFGPHYLGVRLPEAAEEVNDPHNFIVRIVVELGIVGGTLLLAWLLRLGWEMTRPVTPPSIDDRPAPRVIQPGRSLSRMAWIAAGATGVVILSAIDFSQQWEYGAIEVLKRLLYLLLLMLGLVVGSYRSTRLQQLDERPAPLLLYALLVGLAIFLLHNLVDFSLFETGPLFMFAMLAGAALGVRLTGAPAMRRPAVLALLGLAALAWVAAAVGLAAPVAIAESEAQRGDDELRAGSPAAAANHLRTAHETLWIRNGDYAFRAARAMIMAGAPPHQVRSMLAAAVEASPMNAAYPRLRAEYELRQPAPDAQRVIADYERVIRLDPNDISAHLDYARALERFARGDEARQRYEQALRLNDLLDPAEPERLPQATIDAIRARIDALR